ncbi:hypothetical protein [Tenacibaculum soleae]|uniref:hypothetical protein n=1 Tax=Tenacibaculum soleae TaxID=447689 RepID=UPI0026E16002|nr:hypothetical protein [Tenacibaculum soleae]MDO6813809.1 hypothetical protein [Tenacibaculum soleae]
MIQEIKNHIDDHHIDTFYKIAVFEKSYLPNFTHLTPDAVIEDYITNITDSSQVMLLNLLQNNIKVNHSSSAKSPGKLYKTKISFTVTPQDKNVQQLLETYNNKEVVVLVSKRETNHLYGTTAQPLLFSFSELNNAKPNVIKGYSIQLTGTGYGGTKLFEEVTFNVFTRGLALQLAASL